MSVLNTTRLNEIIHHLQSVYNTYNLPQQPLCLKVEYDQTVHSFKTQLTEADTDTVGEWPIRPVRITARVFLDPQSYPDMLDQPTANLCDNRIEIEHDFSVGDSLASLHIYCPVEPADLSLLESMGITKKQYSSFSSYSHTCSLN